MEFPSPHSGILFLWRYSCTCIITCHTHVSVPSFGDSFFILIEEIEIQIGYNIVSVPSFGDSFFISKTAGVLWKLNMREFPSPHSGILFLSVTEGGSFILTAFGFRPLIRGFFFYEYWKGNYVVGFPQGFPSPHSGILFLSIVEIKEYATPWYRFPSPHSGILFLSRWKHRRVFIRHLAFPSPHSGILFL